MITHKASVAQKCFLFDLYDRQWSLTKPRSPKYVSYLDSMIINDLLQSLGGPKNICVLLRFNDHQWSLTKPRSRKYVSSLDSMSLKKILT